MELAKALNGEIINGDSMQVYAGLDNITNKHPIPERQGIPHHLLGHVPWKDEYTVNQFQKEAIDLIDSIHDRGKVPIIVGGTHYYAQSLLFKNTTLSSLDNKASSVPLSSEQLAILDDPARVLDTLKQVDPIIAQKFHPNDTRRLRRALEIFYTKQQRASDIYAEQQNPSEQDNSMLMSLRYRTLIFWVYCDQLVLDPRLDVRVDQMLANGLYDEVNDMYKEYKASSTPVDLERGVWQVIGFKQFLPWLQGQESTPDDGINSMKQATRKYARRQTKWISKKLVSMLRDLQAREQDCGDIALLDATDLSQWHHNVYDKGLEIAKSFLEGNLSHASLAPPGLEDKLVGRTAEQSFNRDKWKHYVCETCVSSDGSPHVSVGQEAWETHLKSRKHKATLRRIKKQKEYQDWKKSKPESEDSTTTTTTNEID